MDAGTRLLDVSWNGVILAQVNWDEVPRLGDEGLFSEASNRDELVVGYQRAARAYRGLAKALDAQGLAAPALRYRRRQHQLERAALWRDRKFGQWLFSCVLNISSGYGDQPLWALGTYLAVISAFAGVYALLAHFGWTSEHFGSWDSPFVLSVTSFHGRVFFAGGLPLTDWAARVGAIESAVGLLIEITFIATFTQRFFAR